MLRVQPPDVESVIDDFRKVSIDSATEQWQEISKLKLAPTDHRGSMQRGSVSNISEDSRGQSLFADAESQLTKILSIDSSGLVDESQKSGERPEEVFTDKARAAMVVIGTKDIKEALDRKKAVEVFRKTPEAKCAYVFFQQSRFLVHQSRFREALVFINKALQVDPQRKEWITERSLCYFKLLQPETALRYVDEVLKLDPKYFQALLLKGEILYSMWDLESAMLCFVEGRRLRPDNTECIRGVHKIRMALEEISAYRETILSGKRKKPIPRRIKSAKEKTVSYSSSGSFNLGTKSIAENSNQHYSSRFSPLSDDKSSSALSYEEEEVNQLRSKRPVTAYARRKSLSEAKVADDHNQIGERQSRRPVTTRGKRYKSPTKLKSEFCLDSITDTQTEHDFLSDSSKSDSSLKVSSGCSETDGSGSDTSEHSVSRSMDASSKSSQRKKVLRRRLSKSRQTPKSWKNLPDGKIPMSSIGPNVSAALGKDRAFLESILKNKGLKRAKTSHTKKALHITRDLHKFVAEREEYWRNRERFIRYAKETDIFIA